MTLAPNISFYSATCTHHSEQAGNLVLAATSIFKSFVCGSSENNADLYKTGMCLYAAVDIFYSFIKMGKQMIK